MKRLIVAFALALFSYSALADLVIMEASRTNSNQGKGNGDGKAILYFKDINKNFDANVELIGTDADHTHATSTKIEFGLRGKYLTDWGYISLKGTWGNKASSSSTYDYYAIEPGVKVNLGQTPVSVSFSYKMRDTFNSKYHDDTDIARYSIFYKINENNTVGFRYDAYRGDSNQDMYSLNWGIHF